MRRLSRPENPLERLMRPYRRRLYLPLLLALAAVVLFIWQSALLAALFAGWLNAASAGQKPLSDGLRTILPLIVMCLLLRSLLSLLKERVLQKLSLHVRHGVRRRLLHAPWHGNRCRAGAAARKTQAQAAK